MTPTDKLHRELDKRGIRWRDIHYKTAYRSPMLGYVSVWENSDGGFALEAGYAPMTLEQVIEATLGKTCHNIAPEFIEFRCSACGYNEGSLRGNHDASTWSYCPNCGARIEVES